MASPQDPNWYWDGSEWLWWNGSAWQAVTPAAPTPPPPPAATAAPVAPPPAAPPAPVTPPVAAYGAVPPTPPTVATATANGGRSGLRVSGNALIAVIGVLALLIVIVGGGVIYLLARDSGDSATNAVTVATEPLSSATDPFTPAGSAGTDTPVTPVQPSTAIQVPGGKAGLYGGTLKATQCNKSKLVAYLDANPSKAAAWAGVQGIPTTAIASYVAGLTSVILRSDTSVMNHGYVNGKATTFQSVLQAGTAVLVNDRGLPVVKCYCGNPLSAPPVNPGPVIYKGPTWSGWAPGHVTVVVVNTTVITNITLINITNNQPFSRPTGTDGTADVPTTLPPDTTSPTPEPTTGNYTGEQAYALLIGAVDKCVTQMGEGAFNGLTKTPGKYAITETPTGQGDGLFTVKIVEKSTGTAYKFTVNVPARTIVPANEAAAGVAEVCKGLNNG